MTSLTPALDCSNIEIGNLSRFYSGDGATEDSELAFPRAAQASFWDDPEGRLLSAEEKEDEDGRIAGPC